MKKPLPNTVYTLLLFLANLRKSSLTQKFVFYLLNLLPNTRNKAYTNTLYGINAFTGIVNVITKQGAELGKMNLTATTGSSGRKNVELSHGNKVSENFSYNIAAKYFGASDLHPWDFMTLDYEKDFSQEYKENLSSPKVLRDGKLVDYSLDEKLPYNQYSINADIKLFKTLTISALLWTKKEGMGYWYNPYSRRGNWAKWGQGYKAVRARHDWKINDKTTLSSDLRYRSHRILDSPEVDQEFYNSFDPNDPNTVGVKHNDVSSYLIKYGGENKGFGEVEYYNLNSSDITLQEQLSFSFSEKISLVTGFRAVRLNTQESYNVGATPSKIIDDSPKHISNTLGIYAEATFRVSKKLILTAGGRYAISSVQNEPNDGYDVFIPRISAVFKASDNTSLRMQYSEAFQEANDWHQFDAEKQLSEHPEHLEPERIESFEIGTTSKISDRFLINISAYSSRVLNPVQQIENILDADAGQHFETSDKDIIITGYEISFTGKLNDKFSFNGALSGAWNREENNNFLGGEYKGDIAPVKINLGLLIKPHKNISLYPKVNYVSTKKTINYLKDPNIEPIVPEVAGYAIVGLNINILNMFGKVEGLNLNLKIDNLLDKEYFNPGPRTADGLEYNAKVLQEGFNLMAGINYHF